MYSRFTTERRAQQAAARAQRAAGRLRAVSTPSAVASPVDTLAVPSVPVQASDNASPVTNFPPAPSLPVEVWVAVCARLSDPRDVFALARTCRAARFASQAHGAWAEVDLGFLDSVLDKRYEALHGPPTLVDLTATVARDVLLRPLNSALGLARFFIKFPQAASSITRLVLPVKQPPLPDDVLAALFSSCTSLRRLHTAPRTPHAVTLKLLGYAAQGGCPLEHVHVRTMTQETVEVLLRFNSTLRSLYVSNANTDEAFSGDVISALEQLVHRLRLTRLELDINSWPAIRLRLTSDTLEEILVSGKGIRLRDVRCPALRSLVIDEGYAEMNHRPETIAAIVATCPLLRDGGLVYNGNRPFYWDDAE
jgi:hypothetical protein